MRRALRAVDQHDRAGGVRARDDVSSGAMVPSVLLTCAMATSLQPSSSASRSSRTSSPRSSTGMKRSSAPVRSRQRLPRNEIGMVLELRQSGSRRPRGDSATPQQ